MSDGIRPARPWLAGMLGFVAVGLGHFYAGRPFRGLAAWSGSSALGIAVLAALLHPAPYAPWNVVVPVSVLVVVWLLLVHDGYRCGREPASWRPKAWMVVLTVGLVMLVDQMGSVATRARLGQALKIPTRSMEPGLALGDHIMVDKRAATVRTLRRGDVVVFLNPHDRSKLWLKRIGGLPGETVEVRDKRLLIDGIEPTELPATYVDGDKTLAPRDTMASVTIAGDHYFMIGDNRDRSYDSRFWGTVPRSDILGKARVVYFSWDIEAGTVRWSRIGTRLD